MSPDIYFAVASVLSVPIAWSTGRTIGNVASVNTNEGSQHDAVLEFQRLFIGLFLGTIISHELLSNSNHDLAYLSVPLITLLASYTNTGARSVIEKWRRND